MGNGHNIFVLILGGTSLFLLGMNIASENLQSLAANRIRDIIVKLADKPVYGLLAGVLITILVQSSGAVTSMLVGLGSAGVVSLAQVMAIILGTGVGSTITTQLLSLNISAIGLPIFGLAFTIHFLTHNKILDRLMQVLMGFGLMFWGLEIIGMGSTSLKEASLFSQSIEFLKSNPFTMMLVIAGFTAVIHSSAAVVGIAMTLVSSHVMDLEHAFYWVYGANIGTTATALLAASGGNHVGRQVAWAHCLHKVASVSVFYFFTPHLAQWLSSDLPIRDVANAHLMFNLAGAIVFFPMTSYGAKLIEKIITPSANEREFSVKYLDRATFESPSVVLAHAERECLRMADIVQSMVADSMRVLKDFNQDLIEDMRARDNKVDLLNREISLFITRFMDNTDGTMRSQMIRLFGFASDLESAADVIDNSILELAQKKHSLRVDFSPEGWEELSHLHRATLEVCTMSVGCFQTQSKDLANKLIFKKRIIRKMEKTMREAHIGRLVQGRQDSINTSSIHLDVLTDYRRVVGLFSNHAYSLVRSEMSGSFSREE